MNIKKNEIVKMIKAFCLECSGGEKGEVRLCTVKRCKLYSLRMGNQTPESEGVVVETQAKTKKPLSDEHKAKLAEGRKKSKEAKNQGV